MSAFIKFQNTFFFNKLSYISFISIFFPLLLILAFSNFTIFAQEEENELIIDSSLVVLNATITDDKGVLVSGLKQDEFCVFEDGKEQKIEFFESQKTPFAAVILIDTSGSMEQRIALATSAAINFLDGLRLDDKVAIYNFDSKVSMVQDFSNLRDIAPKVFDLKARGMTVLNDGIYEAAKLLSNRPEKRRAIIVLSDGEDTQSGRSATKALKAALQAEATIYTVDMSGITDGGKNRMQNQSVLKNFAKKSGGKFVETPGGVQLREAFKNIVDELGNQYTFGYQPTNARNDGKWREIEVKIKRPNLQIRTRDGYYAAKK